MWAQPPRVSSLAPLAAPVGTSVTISGTNFNAVPGGNLVYFGATRAIVTSATPTTLIATVPIGAGYGNVSVTVNGLTGHSPQPFVVTFANGGSLNKAYFGDQVSLDEDWEWEANDIVSADFDNDNKSDIAIVDERTGLIYIYRNTSQGTTIAFSDYITITAPGVGKFLLAEDMNGDGRLDLVAGNANSFSVFSNTSVLGSISFGSKTETAVTGIMVGIVVADFNNDGKLDVITSSSTIEGYISIVANSSTGGAIAFSAKRDIPLLGGIGALAAADIDGDGKIDLAVANRLVNQIGFLRNTSSGAVIDFGGGIEKNTGTFPSDIAIGDIDGDGKQDIVVSNLDGSQVNIFRNFSTSGNLVLTSAGNFDVGAGGSSVSLADYNGDGKVDIGVACYLNTISFLQNTSTPGYFSFQSKVSFFADCYSEMATGDYDGDGRIDISYLAGPERVVVLKNKAAYPQPLSFVPSSTGQGKTVTITGANFTGVSAVAFGGTPATSFSLESPASIKAVVGNGSSGDITVTGPAGSGYVSGFTFIRPPVISSFSPGTAGTGTIVEITGERFTGASSITFGGVAATSITVISDSRVQAKVGAGASGDVSVTAIGGTGSRAGFTYVPAPAITGFSPTSGVQGTIVSIQGSNFMNVTSVKFGGVAASSYTVVNTNTIRAVVGTGASGSVEVISQYGATTIPGFIHLSPVITGFTPTSAAQGGMISITGSNLTGTTAVSFGGIPAASFSVINSTTITAQVANGASGALGVTTQYGTAEKQGFNYTGPPVINSFLPAYGSTGSLVKISGLNLAGITEVRFGDMPAQRFTIINDRQIEAFVGGGASGDVSVKSNNGTTSMTGFVYREIPAISSFLPISGSGGTAVTIQGSNFSPVLTENTVFFGKAKAIVTAAAPDQLEVIAPAGATYAPISVLVNGLRCSSHTPFRLTFSNNGVLAFDESSFNEPQLSGFVYQPTQLEIEDFDNDGKLDAAALGNYNSNIYISRNETSGEDIRFASAQYIQSYYGVFEIRTADFDGDGKRDIITLGSSTFSLFKNISVPGSIAFDPYYNVSVGAGGSPKGFIVEDLDGDGKQDLLTGMTSPNIAVYRNISQPGSFNVQERLLFTFGQGEVVNLATGDLDGDRKPEVVVLRNDGKLTVFKNSSTPGNISFTNPVHFQSSSYHRAVSIGDLDLDGKADIVVTQYAYFSNNILLFRNTGGAGSISFEPTVFAGRGASEVHLANLNGDEKPEIVLSDDARVCVFQNTSVSGNLHFEERVDYPGPSAKFVKIADLSDDGKPDLIYSSSEDDIGIRVNQLGVPQIVGFSPATATTGNSVTITGSYLGLATSVLFGGVPATSFTVNSLQVITAEVGLGASGEITVITPLGTVVKPGFTFLPGPQIISFAPASAGANEEVVITGNNFTNVTGVYFGEGAAAAFEVLSPTSIKAVVGGGFSGGVRVTSTIGTTSKPGFTYKMAKAPIIESFSPLSGSAGSSITINGSNFDAESANNIVTIGGVRAQVTASTANQILAVVPRGMSQRQIVVTNKNNNLSAFSKRPFIVTWGQGLDTITSNSFDPKKLIQPTSAGWVQAINMADLDADGKQELMYGGFIYKNASIGPGQISFTRPAILIPGSGEVFLEDLDGDTRPDIIRGDSVYLNNSIPGTLEIAPGQFLGFKPEGFGDIDGDGRLDVVARNNTHFLVYLNMSTAGKVVFSDRSAFSVPILTSPGSATETANLIDVDMDGKLDLLLIRSNLTAIRSFRNITDNRLLLFSESTPIEAVSGTAVLPAHFSADRSTDIIIPRLVNYISIHSNKSTPGNFQLSEGIPELIGGYSDFKPGTGDLDGDGKAEIVSSSGYSWQSIVILKNISSGSQLKFQDAGYMGPMSQAAFGSGVQVCDIDLDGRPDLTFANTYELSVYRNRIPGISSISPTIGGPGTSVTITGVDFQDVTAVSFGGKPAASFIVNSSTSITAVVGNGASGQVTVATSAGNTSIEGFVYNAPTPVIDLDNEIFTMLKLTPNPARIFIEVKHPSILKTARLEIFDISGIRVINQIISPQTKRTSFNVNKLAAGIYRVVWTSGEDRLGASLTIQ